MHAAKALRGQRAVDAVTNALVKEKCKWKEFRVVPPNL